MPPQLMVERFPTILRDKHHMILAVPHGMAESLAVWHDKLPLGSTLSGSPEGVCCFDSRNCQTLGVPRQSRGFTLIKLKVLATLLPLGFPLDAWLDTKGKALRISARITSIDSERFLALADKIRQQGAQMSLPMWVTGTNYLLAQMSHALVHNQVSSLACAVVMILGTITI